MKMGQDKILGLGHKIHIGTIDNFDVLVDIEVLLSLALFIPLVNAMYALIKLFQAKDIFVCDFMQAIKLCQSELVRLFIDCESSYNKEDFPSYNELISLQCKHIPLQWKELPGDSSISHLLFDIQSISVEAYGHNHDKQIGQDIFVM